MKKEQVQKCSTGLFFEMKKRGKRQVKEAQHSPMSWCVLRGTRACTHGALFRTTLGSALQGWKKINKKKKKKKKRERKNWGGGFGVGKRGKSMLGHIPFSTLLLTPMSPAISQKGYIRYCIYRYSYKYIWPLLKENVSISH